MNHQLIDSYMQEKEIKRYGYFNIQSKELELEKRYELIHEQVILKEENSASTLFEKMCFKDRIDLKRLDFDVKSVIIVGIPYEIMNQNKPKTPDAVKVSNFSWEYDYHVTLEALMMDMLKYLGAEEKLSSKIVVDTSPYFDRLWFYLTGQGTYGKNQMMIDEEYGTGIYIGYVFLNQVIDSEKINRRKSCTPSLKNQDPYNMCLYKGCQSCHLCVQACPVNILGKSFVDTSKCRSYITQKKEDLTEEEMANFGEMLYGCDICQSVCPSNGKVFDHQVIIPEKFRRQTVNEVDIETLLYLNNKAFKKQYGHMGFSWRGVYVMKRNALIIMGNRKLKKNVPFLENYKIDYINQCNKNGSEAKLLPYINRAIKLSAREGQI